MQCASRQPGPTNSRSAHQQRHQRFASVGNRHCTCASCFGLGPTLDDLSFGVRTIRIRRPAKNNRGHPRKFHRTKSMDTATNTIATSNLPVRSLVHLTIRSLVSATPVTFSGPKGAVSGVILQSGLELSQAAVIVTISSLRQGEKSMTITLEDGTGSTDITVCTFCGLSDFVRDGQISLTSHRRESL